MLLIKNLKVYHGQIEAVHGIDMTVEPGQCVALLGPNGAGNASTLSAIVGTAKSTGSIQFEGTDISSLLVEARFRRHIALSPEGYFQQSDGIGKPDNGRAIIKDKNIMATDIDGWFERFPILGERRHQNAGTLSGGEQQMLATVRALLSKPRIFLMDDPSLGLAPQITKRIFDIIRDLKASGMTILLVEQNAHAAIGVSDYVYVLNNGMISSEGPAGDFGDGSALMDELTGGHS